MHIGNVILKSPAVMAPMAGLSDLPFRRIVMEYGAGMVTTELISANALVRESAKTFGMLPVEDEPHPNAAQIFGGDVDVTRDACVIASEKTACDIIDVNFGCPVKKVTKCGAGAAMLKDVEKAGRMVEAVVMAVRKPVTVKIRAGWDMNSVNAVDMALALEQAGAAAITVHARTASQGYSGTADWNVISKVAGIVKIPVIGNGDIVTPEIALWRLSGFGCAAVMIGRGALGAPWIFRQINELLASGSYSRPGAAEVMEVMLRHLDMMIGASGEIPGVRRMRAHLGHYTRGLPSASRLRDAFMRAASREDVARIASEYLLAAVNH
ncbi:MAG: tRNA dihydrouridine synthase DusB [Nitrospinae bacterium]|nr:tRNA dihydrouridine synthase DusB [Nitrospinota bacterium]